MSNIACMSDLQMSMTQTHFIKALTVLHCSVVITITLTPEYFIIIGVDAMSGGRGPQAAAPGGEVEDAAGGGAVAGGHQGLHRLHLLPHALHNHSLGIKSSQVLPILRVHVPSLEIT